MNADKTKSEIIRALPVVGGRIADRLEGAPTVGVLRLTGVIGHLGPGRRRGLSLSEQAGSIDRAFKLPRLKAVALAINSPGGSPVQAALIARRIRQLAEEKEIPIYAFCEDVAASGGYWLACAAEEIYADPASIVGSIGVISAGFGFVDLLEKVGVERRVHTSGDKKGMLDPFAAEKADDIERLRVIQEDIHEQFKDYVRDRRAAKLAANESVLFSGEFWTGRRGTELGLVDGLGDLRSVMREKFGEKVNLRLVGVRKRFGLGRLLGGQADLAGDAFAAVEERLHWGRFGL
ncbi:MAG: S49 family peptidase [Pseudomonadota bacterium]|nr:S49 family peptidase [Pseudomonadota bacterium]